MLTMRVVHAHEGDCFFLIYGSAEKPRALLCDGGPKETFEPHIRGALKSLPTKELDAVILSHVDNDHVLGLLDLFTDLRDEHGAGALGLTIADLWVNEFDKTLDRHGKDIQKRARAMMASLAAQGHSMGLTAFALQGIGEAHRLRQLAAQLKIQVNKKNEGEPFLAGTAFDFHGLDIKVVGPTQANLDALEANWDAWLEKQQDRLDKGKLKLAAMSDRSVPNLSSIQLHVTDRKSKKTLLLTGDGRGDHLLDALEEAELLDDEGGIDVDVLKVPHHGSDRNATRAFFERVRAKIYVISADGKHGNPDLPTLEWIVEANAEASKPVSLYVTNETPTVKMLVKAFPPEENNYRLHLRKEDADFIDVKLD